MSNTTSTFSALAEPNRLRIVQCLRSGPRPVNYLVKRLRMRQPQVSKHLSMLKKAGLVDVKSDKQQRIYTLQSKPFEEMESWLRSYKQMWEERLDRLEEYLETEE